MAFSTLSLFLSVIPLQFPMKDEREEGSDALSKQDIETFKSKTSESELKNCLDMVCLQLPRIAHDCTEPEPMPKFTP